jgi:hypothetical protein
MASGDERRMLFDIRGRRRNVIRVVYATLALLMGASLFVAVGPFNLAELVGQGGSGSSAAEVYEEQAERIEERLAKNPANAEDQLLRLTRVRLGAGQVLAEQDPATGTTVLTPEAIEQYELGQEAWNRYLKEAGDDVNPAAAGLVATSYFSVAEQSETLGDIEENIEGATKAQRIAAEASPNLNTLSTLAIFQYFNGEFETGDKTAKRAAAEAPKAQRKAVEKQLASTRKRADGWDERRRKFAKQQAKQGKEQLQNPLGGLSGGSGF